MIETVEFEATPPQRDKLNDWLVQHGTRLTPKHVHPFATTPRYENPDETKRYTAEIPTDFRFNVPPWVTDLIVKR